MRFARQVPTATWGPGTTSQTDSPSGGALRDGFTLIEVLLVLAIMGILCVIALPNFFSAVKEHRLRGATRSVMSAGRYATSLAVISQLSRCELTLLRKILRP